MEKTINFTMTDNQAKSFEKLFEDFNETMKRMEENKVSKEEEINKYKVESKLLLSQIKEQVELIKISNSQRRKMLWEI
jgi:hypothetical protein